MDRSTPGFPVLHHLLELAQTRVHPVGDAVQPSHPPSSPSLPALHPARGQVECIKCPKMMRVLKRSFYLWFMFLLRCCKIRHCFLQKIQSKYSLTYRILLRRYHRSESGTRRMTMHTQSLFHLPVNQEEHPMANQCVPLPQSRRSGACPHFCFIYVVASGCSCAVWILHCVIQISYCGVRTLWLWHVRGWPSLMAQLVKKSACNARHPGSIPGSGSSPGGGSSNLLQYPFLENPMNRGAWGCYSPWGHTETDTSEWLNTCGICVPRPVHCTMRRIPNPWMARDILCSLPFYISKAQQHPFNQQWTQREATQECQECKEGRKW